MGEVAKSPSLIRRHNVVKPPSKQCRRTGKHRHQTKGMAEAQLRSLVKRGLERPELGPLHTYQCPLCRWGWHTGHIKETPCIDGPP